MISQSTQQTQNKTKFLKEGAVFYIYIITSLVSDRFYIGATGNHWARKGAHFRDLESGTHHCRKLQGIFNESPDTIYFNVIKEFIPRSSKRYL